MSGLTKELENISVSTTRTVDISRSTGKTRPSKARETTGMKEKINAAVTKAVVLATQTSLKIKPLDKIQQTKPQ